MRHEFCRWLLGFPHELPLAIFLRVDGLDVLPMLSGAFVVFKGGNIDNKLVSLAYIVAEKHLLPN